MIVAIVVVGKLLATALAPLAWVSFPALIVVVIGGLSAGLAAYTLVTAMEMDAVWQVSSVIGFGSVLATGIGHWLGAFGWIGEYWGGVIAGSLETAVLWGALYGAREVWKAGRL
jgi:hypothetical protein